MAKAILMSMLDSPESANILESTPLGTKIYGFLSKRKTLFLEMPKRDLNRIVKLQQPLLPNPHVKILLSGYARIIFRALLKKMNVVALDTSGDLYKVKKQLEKSRAGDAAVMTPYTARMMATVFAIPDKRIIWIDKNMERIYGPRVRKRRPPFRQLKFKFQQKSIRKKSIPK